MHQNVERTTEPPEKYKGILVNGAKVNCVSGHFGLIVNQNIPSDSWRIGMHHFFFNGYTWIQYPKDEIYPLIIYNYGQELKIYTYVGPDHRVKMCGREFLKTGVFNALTGDYALFPTACEKGNYHFFTVSGHLHQVEAILRNPVLAESIFPELIKVLTGIGKQVKAV
jgi:hypothetical protein